MVMEWCGITVSHWKSEKKKKRFQNEKQFKFPLGKTRKKELQTSNTSEEFGDEFFEIIDHTFTRGLETLWYTIEYTIRYIKMTYK
jgi:hypothetical protein